ncbi:MAG: hypothetical protein GXO37_02660 [Chloroflexi bacterium]|nr:hypothetical protein [Chloroflexota bacterium]
MRRYLARVLGVVTRFVVGFFPVVAALFLFLIEPWAAKAYLGVLALAVVVALLLFWFARRDAALRQAIGLGFMLLMWGLSCGIFVAALLSDVSLSQLWRPAAADATRVAAASTAAVETPPVQRRLWREAAPDWMGYGGRWPTFGPLGGAYPVLDFLPGGQYVWRLTRPYQALVVVAPWGAPQPDVFLRAAARWGGPSDEGVWGVVCRYQGSERFYAFTWRGDGWAAIWKHSPEGIWALAPWRPVATPPALGTPQPWASPTPQATPTPGLPWRRGQGSLSAMCQGSHLRLYVDGLLVAEAEDEAYRGGRVGLWAVAPAVAPWEVQWQDFDVYELFSP